MEGGTVCKNAGRQRLSQTARREEVQVKVHSKRPAGESHAVEWSILVQIGADTTYRTGIRHALQLFRSMDYYCTQ